jgi:hypothetical protein
MSTTRKCANCGELFEPRSHNAIYCCYACRYEKRVQKEKLEQDTHIIGSDCGACHHPREAHFGQRGKCWFGDGICDCSHFRYTRKPQGKTLMQLHDEGKL